MFKILFYCIVVNGFVILVSGVMLSGVQYARSAITRFLIGGLK